MTDRHSGYVVVLNADMREDDAESVINALRMVKGVQSVEPIVNSFEQVIATSRAKHEILMKVYAALDKIREDEK